MRVTGNQCRARSHELSILCSKRDRRDKSAAETDLITGAEYVNLIKLISYQTPGAEGTFDWRASIPISSLLRHLQGRIPP